MQSLARKLFLPFFFGTIILFLSLVFFGIKFISTSHELVTSMESVSALHQRLLQVNLARTNTIYLLADLRQSDLKKRSDSIRSKSEPITYQESKFEDTLVKYRQALENYQNELSKNKGLDTSLFIIYANESIAVGDAILQTISHQAHNQDRSALLDKWESIDEELDATLSDLSAETFLEQKNFFVQVKNENRLAMIFLAMIAVLLVISYVLKFAWVNKVAITPLHDLSLQIKSVDLKTDVASYISLKDKTEIGYLANVFNDLLNKIKAGNQKLAKEVLARELQELEAKKLAANLAIEKAKLIQAEKLSALGTLVGGVAHEISNPLMGIISYMDYLLKHITDTNCLNVLKKANDQIVRIQSIVSNMLVFARTGTSASETELGTEVGLTLTQVIDLLASTSRKNNVAIITGEFARPLNVKIAPSNLQQILLNIIKNAIEAASESKSTQPTVKINIKTLQDTIQINIEDNGPGVTLENQIKLFEPFFTTKPPGQGTGLGLAISKEITEGSGGSIEYDDTFKDGARFVITLPTIKST